MTTLLKIKCQQGTDTLEIHKTKSNVRFRVRNDHMGSKLDVEIGPEDLKKLIEILTPESANKKLNQLMADRQVFLDEEEAYYAQFSREELGSEDLKEFEEKPEKEELRKEILDFIKQHRDDITVENIFEGITSTGGAPCLLYDDDSNFAVGGSGWQNVVALEAEGKGPEDRLDFQGRWNLQKKNWKPTVREAINNYLDN